jgi:cellulose synthase operon protein C
MKSRFEYPNPVRCVLAPPASDSTIASSMKRETSKGGRLVLAVAAGLLLVVTGWLHLNRDQSSPLLPAEESDPTLPAAWHERVRVARAAAANGPERLAAVRELARLYHANHRYEEARNSYEILAGMGAGLSPQDRYLLADVALQAGELAQAQRELQAVLEIEPNYIPARVALALARLKAGQVEEAQKTFAAVLSLDPRHIEATVNLARLELQRGEAAAARERLERLVAERPEATSAVALLAPLLERQGQVERAERLRVLSQQRPEPTAPDPWLEELDGYVYDVAYLGLRFEQLAQSAEVERAQRFLQRIEELEPGSALPPLLQGAAAARARRHDEAAAHFQAALSRGGDPEKIVPPLVNSLFALGQVESAETLLARYVAERPESVPLLVAYSEVFVREKSRAPAREVLSRTLEYQPYLVPQSMALAEILWADEDFAGAARRLRRVADVDPTHFAARVLLGEYHLRRGEPAAALSVLEEAQGLAPEHAEARDSLAALQVAAHVVAAQSAWAEGAAEQARSHLDRAATIAPADAQVYAARAQVLAQLGDLEGTAEALRKLAELQPENPTVLLSLGDVLARQGRGDLAVRHWITARRLVAPGDERLRDALEQRLRAAVTGEAGP